MYFGNSALVDFAFCAGLGVAAACCVVTAIQTVSLITLARVRDGSKNALRTVVFLLSGAALLSIAAFIGATKSVRDADSVLGFVVGVLAVVLLSGLIRRITRLPETKRATGE
jgi:membrane associated rhomboid family serine protease